MHVVVDLFLSLPLSITVKKNYIGCCARELVCLSTYKTDINVQLSTGPPKKIMQDA
tara:strand:- start:487 stop:654 length:168 start_codon:yes stop_codon:yes gene_type:complete